MTVMIDSVKDLADSKNSKLSLRISEDLLLAPTYDDVSKTYVVYQGSIV